MESAGWKSTEEYADGSDYEENVNLGNFVEGDGVRYKGRGLIQLTGRANYKRMSLIFRRNLIRNCNPRAKVGTFARDCYKIVSEFPFALEVSGQYWKTRVIDDGSNPALSLNTLADYDDFEGVTRNINGVSMLGLDRRKLFTQRAKIMLAKDTTPGIGESQDVFPDPDFKESELEPPGGPRRPRINPPPQAGRYIAYMRDNIYHFTDGKVDLQPNNNVPAPDPSKGPVAYYLNNVAYYYPETSDAASTSSSSAAIETNGPAPRVI